MARVAGGIDSTKLVPGAFLIIAITSRNNAIETELSHFTAIGVSVVTSSRTHFCSVAKLRSSNVLRSPMIETNLSSGSSGAL